MRRILIATVCLTFIPGSHVVAAPATREIEARHGVVVSDSASASEAGVRILKKGGNAVDAAVATAFALAVTLPQAGNIGGGGFMMVAPGGGAAPVCIDYRETAPAVSTRDMFVTRKSHLGHKIVGVPGTVRGLGLAHQRYGKLSWKKLLQPAIRLATEGFVLNGDLARSLNGVLANSREFVELQRVFAKPDNSAWHAGDRLVQPDLAKTLNRLAEQGPDAFYHGTIAKQIVAEMKAGGGLISPNDLARYRAIVREPIRGTYRGYLILGPPPPSSGGICLVEMLNILENFDLRKQGRCSPQTLHLMIEAMRRVYCDRARHLGDTDFVSIPEHLTSKPYARKLAGQIDKKRATRSETLAPEITLAHEGPNTTHFSVIDSAGMAVSNTYTLEQSYGSRVVVRGAGFLLNNEMGDFNWRPGHTDRRGAIGTDPNTIAPGKRMLSSQTPVIVTRGGKPVLVTGSPGGRTIINTVLCVIVNVLEFDMPLRAATEAPRLHHQWFPDKAWFEGADRSNYGSSVATLRRMGHVVERSGKQGTANSIMIVDGIYVGVSDPRRSGVAAGY